LIWIIVAAVLAGAESLSLDLVLIMCAGGASAGAVSAVLGAPAAAQVAVAIGAAVALLAFVRPVARRHLTTGGELSGTAALVGRPAVVMSEVSSAGGRVRLNGSEWSARTLDANEVIGVGATVHVLRIDGATAVVWHAS
jgi:membrane protein implicated in regulation of membrane protease activity